MSPHLENGSNDLVLLNLATRIRRSWFGKLYRKIPLAWRLKLSRRLAERAFVGLRFPRTPAWDRSIDSTSFDPLPMPLPGAGAYDSLGVNIIGYIRGQFGLAESARMYASSLIGAGVNVRLYDLDLGLPRGWEDRSLEPWIGEDLPHAISIIFVNPDYFDAALEKIRASGLHVGYLIACWFWELERVPSSWASAISQVDEIMVATRFIENSFRSCAKETPIMRVPQPLSPVIDSGLQRRDFGLDVDKFIFLTTFDFNSWIERKNPFAAISAFSSAFENGRDDVRLLIKSSNGIRYPEQFRRLLKAASSDPRIIIRDDVIDRAHVRALQRNCDAYISLHRAEGFGLGLAECMSIGKPVIGTAWSGNMDFMDSSNSCPVGYEMIPVGENEYPFGEGVSWAEPDSKEAAMYMRRLVDEPGFAKRLGAKAVRDVEKLNSPGAAAHLICERLGALQLASAEGMRGVA